MPRFSGGSTEQAEVEKDQKTVEHLIEIHYYDPSTDSESIERITTASEDITTSGYSNVPDATWDNLGIPQDREALSIAPVQETSDLRAQSVELTLDGVDQTITGFLGTHHFRGREIGIWRVWFDYSAGTINEIVKLWEGLQNDPYEITQKSPAESGGEAPTSRVKTTSVSNMARLQQSKPVLTNEDSHNNMLKRAGLSTGDTSFQHVESIQDKAVYWGVPSPDNATGGGRSTSGGDSHSTQFLPEGQS